MLEETLPQQATYSFTNFYKRPSTFYIYPSYLFLVINHSFHLRRQEIADRWVPFKGLLTPWELPSSSFKLPSSASPHTLKSMLISCVCAHLYLLHRSFFSLSEVNCLNHKKLGWMEWWHNQWTCKPPGFCCSLLPVQTLKAAANIHATLSLSGTTAVELPDSYLKHSRAFLGTPSALRHLHLPPRSWLEQLFKPRIKHLSLKHFSAWKRNVVHQWQLTGRRHLLVPHKRCQRLTPSGGSCLSGNCAPWDLGCQSAQQGKGSERWKNSYLGFQKCFSCDSFSPWVSVLVNKWWSCHTSDFPQSCPQ